ncbi:MAG: ComF family protein [Gammaproteobacteria bacterium]
MVNNWLDIIQNYLLPPTCIFCGHTGTDTLDLCGDCRSLLIVNERFCRRCAAPLEADNCEGLICGDCQKRRVSFDSTFAPYIYQGAMRFLISGLKFGAQYKHARLLAKLMIEGLDSTNDRPGCLVPVPLHKKRYRERGFNQAAEIARIVSHELAIPLIQTHCIRSRDTPHQIDLSAKQRRKNVKRAFTVTKPLAQTHVAIIDDVMTTGATVAELAIALKKSGVERVDVWVCARA